MKDQIYNFRMFIKISLCFLTTLWSVNSQALIKVAITIDDLPLHGQAPKGVTRNQIAMDILKALKKHNVPEVYGFINAVHLKGNPQLIEILKLWREAGYPLGNHTFSHASLMRVGTVESFSKEIQGNESVLADLAGNTDWKYFRYPFLHEGETLSKRETIRQFLFERGYKIAQVTVDFDDWSWNTPYSKCGQKNDKNAIQKLHDAYLRSAALSIHNSDLITSALFHPEFPHVLLLHVGAFTAQMLDELLTQYESMGVQFITLSEALKDPAYSIDPGVTFPEGALFQQQVMKARNITQAQLKVKTIPNPGYLSLLSKICQ